jgi:hypothetical protein
VILTKIDDRLLILQVYLIGEVRVMQSPCLFGHPFSAYSPIDWGGGGLSQERNRQEGVQDIF